MNFCVIIYLYLLKGVDEEGNVADPMREVAVGASHEELFLRMQLLSREEESFLPVEPLRDCCVNVQGLIDPESGDFIYRNLSGTAGE